MAMFELGRELRRVCWIGLIQLVEEKTTVDNQRRCCRKNDLQESRLQS